MKNKMQRYKVELICISLWPVITINLQAPLRWLCMTACVGHVFFFFYLLPLSFPLMNNLIY